MENGRMKNKLKYPIRSMVSGELSNRLSKLVILLILGIVLTPQLAWGQELEGLFRQAEEARQNGDYQGAEEIWRQVIEEDPDNAPAYLGLGNRLRDQDKVDEAIAAYEKAIELDPNYAFAYVGLGNALRFQNRLESAQVQYQQAIELNPNLPGVYWNLGNVLAELGNREEAINQFRIALKLKSDSVPVYNDLGLALLEMGNVEEAIATYQQAIDLNSRYVSTYTGLGQALRENNQMVQAIEAYQRAIELNQFEGSAYLGLGQIYYDRQNWDRAIEQYQIAVKLEPSYSVYLMLGYAWQQQGTLSEAIAAYKMAIAEDSNGVLAYYNLQESKRLLAVEEGSNGSDDPDEVLDSEEPENPENISLQGSPDLQGNIARIITPIPNGVNIGTGWVIQREEDQALIVTNREAIAYASSLENDQIQVEFFQRSDAEILPRYSAQLMHITPEEAATNLVVLQVSGIPETIQPLDISTELEDSEVKLIGHPFNAEPWQPLTGYLNSTTQPVIIEANLIQGYSGSPILNEDQQVVAILGQIGEQTAEANLPFTPATSETGIIYPMALIQEQLEAWGVNNFSNN